MPKKTPIDEKTQYSYEKVPQKKFTLLPILDLYILRDYLTIYIACSLGFSILFLIGDLINNLGDFVNNQASIFTAAYFFLLKQPGDIVFVIPLALLLACMYTMVRMGMNNEITAMRASGISLVRCGFSIYCVGLVITFVHFYFNETLVPYCNQEATNVLKSISDPNYIKNKTKMLMYRSPNMQRTWLVKNFISMTKQQDVILKKYNSEGDLVAQLTADIADYEPSTGSWVFHDVKFVEYKKVTLTDNYSPGDIGDQQKVVVPIIMDFKIFDKNNKYFSILGDITETSKDIFNSIKTPEELSSAEIVEILHKSKDLSKLTVGIYKTLLYSRYSFPWVCVLAVFLGVPLAGSSHRKGIFANIIVAAAIITVYMTISQVFMVLGNRGTFPPFIAGAFPTIVFAMYIIYTVFRLR